MKQFKPIFIPTLTASLVLLAGCTAQTAINTNTATDNANIEVVTNTNETVDNENTNTTDDWLTYTNDEYGFSFRYPGEWVLEERQVDLTESETASVLTLRTNINTPGALSMSISVSKQSLDDIVDSVRQYDKEISPVIFEDTFNINGNEVIFIKKKGIDIEPYYYFVSLNSSTVLRIKFFNKYSDVISTLKFE